MDLDERYFKRVQAMEFAVSHDDGHRPEDLINADIVLIGISRTSKTPLSIYLGYRGVRVSNIPLALEIEPPPQLFDVDPRRIFGLVSTPEVLVKTRTARMQEFGTVVPGYAQYEHIECEQEEARALMRQLGCVIINTSSRAIEEVAQEILRYVKQSGITLSSDTEPDPLQS
jgi:regulator of PEP synthase PpsR (kinase-PPPase family)